MAAAKGVSIDDSIAAVSLLKAFLGGQHVFTSCHEVMGMG